MRQQTTGPKYQTAKTLMAGVMLVLWVSMGALAVSPQLHHWLHHDFDGPEHQCFVSHLNKGLLVEAAGSTATAIPASPDSFSPSVEEIFYFSDFDYRVSLSRAPPASSSSVAVVG